MSRMEQNDPSMLLLNVNIWYPILQLHRGSGTLDRSSGMQNGTCSVQRHLDVTIKEQIVAHSEKIT